MPKWIQKLFDLFINYWPPFLGAGIKLTKLSKDHRYCRVEMPMRFYNRNYVGVHFGGSLYSMTDPWFMLMLIKLMGDEFIIWDKAATIRFKKPGHGRVIAEFKITDADMTDIRQTLETQPKYDKTFHVNVVDEQDIVIAEVDKVIYIRKKNQ